jgi:hypothetical protein
MALALAARRRLVAPRGFGLYLVFVVCAVVDLALLGTRAPGAQELSLSTGLITGGYRVAWYFALGIVLLYVGNLSERELPARRVCRWLSVLFMITVAGGWLGVLAPQFEFTSLVERIVPGGLAGNGFFTALTHPAAAEIQGFLGYPAARPSAPFAYTNDWGANFGILLPFFWLEWLRRDAGRRRWIGVAVLLLAAVPVVYSLDRALWGGLTVMVTFAALRAALRGRFLALVALLVAAAAVAAALLVTPLGDRVHQRLDTPHSNRGRAMLASLTVDAVMQASPVSGFGSTRDVEGDFRSIAGGSTAECPECGAPPMGTQGYVWLILFSQGLLGAVLFFAFLLRRSLPFIFHRGPLASAVCAAVAFFLVSMWWYDLLDAPMFTLMIGLALAWRTDRPEEWAA